VNITVRGAGQPGIVARLNVCVYPVFRVIEIEVSAMCRGVGKGRGCARHRVGFALLGGVSCRRR
jgi:hypothetical protein